MSERHSFVTQPISCEKCFAIAEAALCRVDPANKYHGYRIPTKRVIAGCAGGSYSGEVTIEFAAIADRIGETLCHPFSLFLVNDTGDGVVRIPFEATKTCQHQWERHVDEQSEEVGNGVDEWDECKLCGEFRDPYDKGGEEKS